MWHWYCVSAFLCILTWSTPSCSSSTVSGLCTRREQTKFLDTNTFAWRCASCCCGRGARDHPPSTDLGQQVWIMFCISHTNIQNIDFKLHQINVMHTDWNSLSLLFFYLWWFWLTFNKNPPIHCLNKLEYFIRPIKKTLLVNCWPSGKYVHLLYMY